MNTRPDLIIFDMDDVLVHYDIARRMRILAEMTGLTKDEVFARGWLSGFEDRADAGAFASGADYLRGFNAALGVALTRAQWVEARGQAMIPIEGTLQLARRLRGVTQTTVLTNNGPMVREAISELAPEVAEIFGADFHTSSEFSTAKPDPDIYVQLCVQYKVNPSRAMFIDDRLENVRGAERAGLRAHHFVGVAALQARVEPWLLPNMISINS